MVSEEIINNTKDCLKSIEPIPFESFVGELLEQGGYKAIVTKQSGDGGVDVIVYSDGFPKCTPWKVLIQTRRYTANHVQPSTVIDCIKKIQLHYKDYDKIVIITTGKYSFQANQTAKKNDVGLWDGDDLSRYLFQWDALYLLDKYA